MFDIVDPTIATVRERITYVPRPKQLKGLRIGLVENTKKNAEEVLRKVAEILAADYGIETTVYVCNKPQRAPLKEAQIAELKGRVDFAIAGVGD